MFLTATRPPAAWKSARAPATRPAFNRNSSKSRFFQVFGEALWVVAVMPDGEFPDPVLSVAATSPDFVEAAKVSTGDSGPLSVVVSCVFSMMHAFRAVKFDPVFPESLLAATRLVEKSKDKVLIVLAFAAT